jgi:DNA-binding transcriptional MerR regulator
MKYGTEREVKRYYSISEVCKQAGIEKHVLRYWESEVPLLRPQKNRAGNRVYSPKDLELVLNIKELVHGKLYTLQGAYKALSGQEFLALEDNKTPTLREHLRSKLLNPLLEIKKAIDAYYKQTGGNSTLK